MILTNPTAGPRKTCWHCFKQPSLTHVSSWAQSLFNVHVVATTVVLQQVVYGVDPCGVLAASGFGIPTWQSYTEHKASAGGGVHPVYGVFTPVHDWAVHPAGVFTAVHSCVPPGGAGGGAGAGVGGGPVTQAPSVFPQV